MTERSSMEDRVRELLALGEPMAVPRDEPVSIKVNITVTGCSHVAICTGQKNGGFRPRRVDRHARRPR